jgi:hypothetical protein
MKIVNERTGSILELRFIGTDGASIVPDSGRYQISDELSGTVLTSWANFTPTTATQLIAIPQENNRILDTENDTEVRVISVVAQRSGAQCTEEFKYAVRNLRDIPPAVAVVPDGGGTAGGSATII